MKCLSLFSGIGAFEKALKNIGIDIELIGFSEIDKYAIKSYCAIHGVDESLNLGDVSKIDVDKLPKDIDLITHGSPCQDFSVAGKQAGGDKGAGTRSSLMWCTVDIVEKVRPKYVIWENVKNLLSAKHRHNFDSYIKVMESLGYNSYFKVLNAKDYGIPQNRERVYTISIRRDCDETGYDFPPAVHLEKKLKNILENEVPEKYYLSAKMLEGFEKHNKKHKEKGTGFIWKPKTEDDIASTLRANGALAPTDNTIKVIGKCDIKGHDCIKKPELTNKDKRLKSLVDKTDFEEGEVLCLDTYNQTTNPEVSQTLTEPHHNTHRLFDGYRIRKLTPRECFRLMGFSDTDFDKAKGAGISDTQLYKQAGNSIVVNVLEAIFKNLFIAKEKKSWYR